MQVGIKKNKKKKRKRQRVNCLRGGSRLGDTEESPFHKYYSLVWRNGPSISCREHTSSPLLSSFQLSDILVIVGLFFVFNFSLGGKKG